MGNAWLAGDVAGRAPSALIIATDDDFCKLLGWSTTGSRGSYVLTGLPREQDINLLGFYEKGPIDAVGKTSVNIPLDQIEPVEASLQLSVRLQSAMERAGPADPNGTGASWLFLLEYAGRLASLITDTYSARMSDGYVDQLRTLAEKRRADHVPEQADRQEVASTGIPVRDGLLAHVSFSAGKLESVESNAEIDSNGPIGVDNRNGRSGEALWFDGVDDFISLRGIRARPRAGASDYTVALWIKPNAYSGAESYTIYRWGMFGGVVSQPSSNLVQPVYYWQSLSLKGDMQRGIAYRVSNNDPLARHSDQIEVLFDMSGERWSHISVRRDAENITLFVDGDSVASKSADVLLDLQSDPEFEEFILGTDVTPAQARQFRGLSGKHYNGAIDDLLLYDRALLSEEINLLARDTQMRSGTATVCED